MKLHSRLAALEALAPRAEGAQMSGFVRFSCPPLAPRAEAAQGSSNTHYDLITPRVLRAIRTAQRLGKCLPPEVEAGVRRLEEQYGMTENGEWPD